MEREREGGVGRERDVHVTRGPLLTETGVGSVRRRMGEPVCLHRHSQHVRPAPECLPRSERIVTPPRIVTPACGCGFTPRARHLHGTRVFSSDTSRLLPCASIDTTTPDHSSRSLLPITPPGHSSLSADLNPLTFRLRQFSKNDIGACPFFHGQRKCLSFDGLVASQSQIIHVTGL
jgi:hypothetical protein